MVEATSSNTASAIEAESSTTIWEKFETDSYSMAAFSVAGYQTRSGKLTAVQYNSCWNEKGSTSDTATSPCTYSASTTITAKSDHPYAPSGVVNFYKVAEM
jgi:hypothetical protein